MAIAGGKAMKIGDLIKVQSFKDGALDRRIVEIYGETVYVCTDQEWQNAQNDRREPECVGFNRRFVLSR